MKKIVIVGGGLAAHRAAVEIANSRVLVDVTMVSEENTVPYDRPPLSKQFLQDNAFEPRLSGTQIYDSTIKFLPNVRIERIDPVGKQAIAGDHSFAFDQLILATGSRVRRLAFNGVADGSLLYLRTKADALRLRESLVAGRRIVIIGGGFIGLEVAASAIANGCSVTILEAQARVLARSAPKFLSDWAVEAHRQKGVVFNVNTHVHDIRALGTGGFELETSSGRICADVVVVGIGVVPNVELAIDLGLNVADGIVVDEFCRTSRDSILATGEVTSYPVRALGRHVRTESWTAAGEQGSAAGRTAVENLNLGYSETPWLWSDQFGYNIQYFGMPMDAAYFSSVGDDHQDNWMTVAFDEQDRMIGAIAVNRGREMSRLRRLAKDVHPLPEEFLVGRRRLVLEEAAIK